MAGYSAIFFDAYGTLFDLSDAREACAAISRQPDRFVAEWRRRQLEYSWLRTLMGRYITFDQIGEEALDATAAAEGVTLDQENRDLLLRIWLQPDLFSDVQAMMPGLQGQRLGILSNARAETINGMLGHAGLVSAFPWVLSANQVRAYKPAPAVYQLAVAAAAARPEDVFFVSANAWDVAGAASLGLTTCWVNRTKAPPEPLGEKPAFVIPTLTELPGILSA